MTRAAKHSRQLHLVETAATLPAHCTWPGHQEASGGATASVPRPLLPPTITGWLRRLRLAPL